MPMSTLFHNQTRACRSFLLTPGSRPEGFPAAPPGGGEPIIVHLGSPVAPADKGRAREAALAFLRQPPVPDFVRLVRLNSPHLVDGLRDLLALHESGAGPDAIVIPKCESADEIRLVADVLDGAQSTIGIVPMVELARAVFAAHHMAEAHERVCGLFLGGGDLAADLGAEGSWENLLFARPRLVAAAAPTGIAAMDVPYFRADGAGLEREATASRKLGMTGKAALHAEQLEAIKTIFTPPPDAVAHARSIMAACGASGTHTPVLNGHVVEPAMVREAERVLAIAARLRNGASAATDRQGPG